jgi:hypothetical protein
MITVSILINGEPLFTRTAVNAKTLDHLDDTCKYNLDDGSTIIHKRDDGAVKLAKAMLDTIKEPERDKQ